MSPRLAAVFITPSFASGCVSEPLPEPVLEGTSILPVRDPDHGELTFPEGFCADAGANTNAR
jgi:hypothetical protein